MYATYADTSMTPKQAIPTAVSSPAQLSKTSPKTGYAPSAVLARAISRKSKAV